MKRNMITSMIFAAVAATAAFGQETVPDPAIQEAKEETAVVYDLGRFFGYVHTMVTDSEDLVLGATQLETFYEIMSEIKAIERIEADWAANTLEALELDVLSVKQLMEVDQLALAREDSREAGSEPKGGGTGTGPLQTYVAGGAFNPIVDATKTLGQGFAELYTYVEKNLRR
jgi:hypothetical protein